VEQGVVRGGAVRRMGASARWPVAFPARFRSVFSWTRAEPHVRFGQVFLPGLSALGGLEPGPAASLLDRAEALRQHRLPLPEDPELDPTAAWLSSLVPLADLLAVGVAAAHARDADGRLAWYELGRAIVADWVESARPPRGRMWDVPALARRVPTLLHFLLLFGTELRVDRETRRLVLRALDAQAASLASQVSGQPADPWLIAAGRALFMAGRFFDGMEARGWLERGTSILWTQLREQVHDDGGHRGRSPIWHAFVLEQYLEVFAILQAANDDVPIWSRKRVKGMADFLARLAHPDGTIPAFRAEDPGLARPADELLAVAGVLLGEPGLALPGPFPGVWPLLLLGDAGRRAFAHLPRRAAAQLPRALRRTGFYVMPGAPGDVMVLDGGSAPDGVGAGVLGYELSVGGEQLTARPDNTLVATRTADPDDSLVGPESAIVGDVEWLVRDGLIYLAGTRRGGMLSPELRHRRRVFAMPGRFWLVCDELEGRGTWHVESRVHLRGDVPLRAMCLGRPELVVAPTDAVAVRMVFTGGHAVRVRREDGATVVAVASVGPVPRVLGYAFVPRGDEPASLALEHDAFRLRATLCVGRARYVLTAVQDEIEVAVDAA